MSISLAWYDKLTEAIQDGHLATVEKMFTVENSKKFNVCYSGETPLTRAISLEKFEIAFYLLSKECIDVNLLNRWDRTSLMLASRTSNLSLIDSLISRGAVVNQSDLYGDTALHLSAFYDRVDVLNRLLCFGADVDKINNKGCTPLFVALDNLSVLSAHALIKNGCDVNKPNQEQRTPLMALAGRSMKSSLEKGIKQEYIITIVELLISLGVDVNASDKNGNTALHFAVETRNVYIATCLLQYGCKASIINHEGLTAFSKAILCGQYEVANIMTMFCDMNSLVSDDSNVVSTLFRCLLPENSGDRMSQDQRTLCVKILEAVDQSTAEKFRVIISERKALNTIEDEFLQSLVQLPTLKSLGRRTILLCMRQTPMQGVRLLPTPDRLQRFLAYDSNFFNIDLLTAIKLHLAAIEGSTEMLSHYSGNQEIFGIPLDGLTLLEKAVKYERLEFLKLLTCKMDNLPQSLKVLHLAAKTGNINIMQFLLSKGYNPNVKCDHRELPIQIAAKFGHFDLVEFLLSYTEEIPPSDSEGRHIMHYVAASGNSKVMALLLDRQPELVNKIDNFEYTPLHVAMSRGNVYLERNIAVPALFTSILLMDGFIMKLMYAVDKKNIRIPSYREGVCHMGVVKLLLKHGAHKTCRSVDGTPEAVAASYGFHDMIQALNI